MNDWLRQNPALPPPAFAVFFVLLWLVICFIVSLMSGWSSLAQQYRTERPFPAHTRRFQRGVMRWTAKYNGVLTVGSDSEGIYLGVLFLFRLGHPPLFIPWRDVQIGEPTSWFFIMVQTLKLGPDQIPLRLRESLVDFLRAGRDTGELASPDSYPKGF
jgi:hypothetical protein